MNTRSCIVRSLAFGLLLVLTAPLSAQQASGPAPRVAVAASLLASEIATLPPLPSSAPVYYGLPATRSAFVVPRYPERALRFRREGAVIASFVVTPQGTVREASVLKGFFPECDDEVLRVLRRAAFEPARDASGTPIEARHVVRFVFSLGAQ